MLSSTTIALSTSIPIPSARPPNDIIFSDTPDMYMKKNVEIMERGIARPIISVLLILLRNKKSTITAKMPPQSAVEITSFIELSMNLDWSNVMSNLIEPENFLSFFSIPLNRPLTNLATVTVFASASLNIATSTLSFPFTRVITSRSL